MPFMNKQLLTALTIFGVAGSAGAAYAGVSVISNASAESSPANSAASMPVTRTIVYQVGAAGQVTISVTEDNLAVSGSVAGTGWTVVGASATGRHAEVQFTDTVQLVTFAADLVDHDVTVSVTNVAAPGVATTVVPVQVDVSVLSDSNPPAPTPATSPTTAPHNTTPAHTTAPSPKGDDDDDEHEEHEEEEEEDDD